MYTWYKIKFYVKAAIFIVLLGVLFTGLGTLQKKFGRGRTQVQPSAQPSVTPSPNPVAPNPQPSPAPQPQPPTLGDIQRQLIHASKQTTKASMLLERAVEEAEKWQTEIEPMRSGEPGIQVAAFPDLVKKMNSTKKVADDGSISLDGLHEAQKQLSGLKSKVDALANQASSTALTAHEMAAIETLYELANSASKRWSTSVADARAIFTVARSRIIPVAETDLKGREDDLAAKSRIEEIDEEEEFQRKQREAKRLADLERQKKERLAKQEREEKERLAQEERKKLIAKAHSTEVLTKLAPFLQPRTVQPRRAGPGTVKFRRVTKPEPMSLSAIQGIGALDDSVDGLKWLARITGNRQLSSPRWSVYSQPNSWSDADLKMLTEGQQLLREYGPILVETGKLSP